jgi:protein-S-isoprenylcysteine O-methyltransferase Ste14
MDSAHTTPARLCPVTRLFGERDPSLALTGPARIGLMLYGLVAYLAFFVTILYAIGFVTGFAVPKTIDSGTGGPVAHAILVNGAILALFVVQHTIMARPWFKRRWTRVIPAPIERSTFVIAASAILLALFWQWRPMPEVVWNVDATWARVALHATAFVGWATVFASSFMVSHWDLFGLRQTFLPALGRRYVPLPFKITGLYRLVRHPLMLGFLIAFWATPTMTMGHLFFSVMTTAYIIVGVSIEERDLVAHFGDRYREYQERVPAVVPGWTKKD